MLGNCVGLREFLLMRKQRIISRARELWEQLNRAGALDFWMQAKAELSELRKRASFVESVVLC
jgi:hypothetical protein